MRRVATVESTDEIDIALLTTHGLYSIEVKSLYSSIEVRLDNCKDAYCVTATSVGQDGQLLTNGITIDMGVAQNTAHVRALRTELDGLVSPQRIFNVTTYANQCGFEMHAPQGFRYAYVTTTSDCPENIVEVICRIEQKVAACWTNAEVDVLAERLAISYTDSDGSKQANHAKALSTARPSVADSSKSHKKRAHKPKTKAQPKYQSRKSQFIDEDVRDYLNGDYED